MPNMISNRDVIDAPPSTPEFSHGLSRREALVALAALFTGDMRGVMAAPVPLPRERTGHLVLPPIPHEPESAEILTWVEKHLPGLSKEKMRRLLADLDEDEFNTREAASEQLDKIGTAAARVVWPLPHLRASPGDTRSPEQLYRLAKFYKKQNHPTRIPPLKGSAQEILAILAQHGRVSIGMHPGAEKQIAELLAKHTVEVDEKHNSFFEILEASTSGAGVMWRIVDGRVLLSRGTGKLDAREMLISGPLALLKNREQSKEKDAPTGYTLIMEPQQGRVVGLSNTINVGKDFGRCRVCAEPGRLAWQTTYAQQPALTAATMHEAAGSGVSLDASLALHISNRMVPLDGTPVDLGEQRLSALRTEKGVILKQHVWPDWQWCSSPFAADMQGWLMTTGNSVMPVDAQGKPLPANRVAYRVDQRVVIVEYHVTGAAAVWVRGPVVVRDQTVTFEKK